MKKGGIDAAGLGAAFRKADIGDDLGKGPTPSKTWNFPKLF